METGHVVALVLAGNTTIAVIGTYFTMRDMSSRRRASRMRRRPRRLRLRPDEQNAGVD